MKKVIAFVLFLPLLIVSICLAFILLKNNNITNIPKNNTNQSILTTVTPARPVETIQPTSPSINTLDEINLVISSPESGSTFNAATVTVMGSTEPQAFVVVNDKEVIADKDGTFKGVVDLDEGENYISIVAYNDAGNVAEREILITRAVSGL